MKQKRRELGVISKKVIILLGGGLALGLSGNPRTYFRVLKSMRKQWKDINNLALHRAIKNLYKSKLVDARVDKNGITTLVLSEKGRQKVLKYNLDNLAVPEMGKWDKKWRVVLFDIPEKRKRARDAIRHHLKEMKFFEFQKSVFVHPFECFDELEYLIEFYHARPFIRFLVADSIDNELHLKKHFKLL